MTAKLRHCLRETGLRPDADAPYLLPLLSVPEGAAPLADLSPEAHKARTLALLRHLSLHSQERRPRVMAVENVHWSDPSSEEYLARVAAGLSGAQLLLIATYRPGYGPSWLDKSYATQLALSPLRPQDSHAVVRSVLSSTTDSSPWEHAIVGTAGGNPFFLEELAWAVREGGVAQPIVLIPDTVQAVLAARIDRLPPVEKQLLQTAAVIGHEVPLRLLQAIAELPEDALQRGLAHLQAGEFLYETRLAPDLAYIFKHALTHEVAYNSLLQERRRSLHARIVDALEMLAGKRAADQVERLAHHAWQGEVWAKAVVYLRQAGTKAIAGSANREASAHFERALVALAHLPQSRTMLEQAIDVRCELRMALVPLNGLGRICDILHEAEAFARALDDQRRLGKVSILITHYLWSIWDLCASVTSRIVLNTVWVSEAYLRAEHLTEASTLAMQALALAREHKERGTEAWTLRLLADIAMHRDSPEVQQAETHYLQALALADAIGMRPLQAHCHLGLGTLYAKTAQRERARAELIAAIGLYRTMDMTFWLPQAKAALAQVI